MKKKEKYSNLKEKQPKNQIFDINWIHERDIFLLFFNIFLGKRLSEKDKKIGDREMKI